jgi:hypothetical protein
MRAIKGHFIPSFMMTGTSEINAERTLIFGSPRPAGSPSQAPAPSEDKEEAEGDDGPDGREEK